MYEPLIPAGSRLLDEVRGQNPNRDARRLRCPRCGGELHFMGIDHRTGRSQRIVREHGQLRPFRVNSLPLGPYTAVRCATCDHFAWVDEEIAEAVCDVAADRIYHVQPTPLPPREAGLWLLRIARYQPDWLRAVLDRHLSLGGSLSLTAQEVSVVLDSQQDRSERQSLILLLAQFDLRPCARTEARRKKMARRA